MSFLDEYPHGYERDIFENMPPEELYILASIGYYHIKAESESLRATKQSRISSGIFEGNNASDKEKEEAEHLTKVFYNRRNEYNKAKDACMHIYGRYKNIQMHKLMKELEEKNRKEIEERLKTRKNKDDRS